MSALGMFTYRYRMDCLNDASCFDNLSAYDLHVGGDGQESNLPMTVLEPLTVLEPYTRVCKILKSLDNIGFLFHSLSVTKPNVR